MSRSRRVAALLLGAASLLVAGCSVDDAADGIAAPPTEPSDHDGIVDPIRVVDPTGQIELQLGLLDGGAAAYRVLRFDSDETVVVVDTSPIGLDTSAGSFLEGLTIVDSGVSAVWERSFALPTGKRRVSSIIGTQRTVRFESGDADLALEIDTVVVDHGAAFRTRLLQPERQADSDRPEVVTISAERTGFDLDVASTSWMQPHDEATSFTPAYERIVRAARPLESPSPSREGWTLPALFEVDGGWTLLAESDLRSGWAGSHLSPLTEDGALRLAFPDPDEGFGVGEPEPISALPLESPWRVVMTSRDIGDVVESDLIRHLAAPADDRDWGWVEPGRVSWSWWADNESPTNPDRLIDYVDLAAEFGWEYSLIDANWSTMPDEELLRVVEHAASAGVGLLLWYNSGGRNNEVTEAPRGRMSTREIRRAEMERISDLGIRGIKVDFFHSDKPDRIQQYLDILADAADFELLVNFHGSTTPRGWSRTWPNLMTMEAVAGGEQYLFNPGYAAAAPGQNTILPFLRNVAGSMDFTPTTFREELSRATTNGHELALPIVFESALQHLIDTPETYRAQPEVVRSILRDLPTVWDETVFLDGAPDSHVVMARRSGTTWWIGAINGGGDPQVIDLASLLGADHRTSAVGGGSRVRTACDGEEARSWSVAVSDEVPATLELATNGGCAVVVEFDS